MWTYYATIDRVIDGDTIDVIIDLGFDTRRKERLRLYGIDAAEKNTPRGRATMDLLTETLRSDTKVTLQTFKHDKYGRYLAEVYLNGISINSRLIYSTVAKPYQGDSRSNLWTEAELNDTTWVGTVSLR